MGPQNTNEMKTRRYILVPLFYRAPKTKLSPTSSGLSALKYIKEGPEMLGTIQIWYRLDSWFPNYSSFKFGGF